MKKIGNNKILILALGVIILFLFSTVVFGDKGEIIFSHEYHHKMESECSDCHKEALEDSGLAKTHPKMALCGNCHDIEEKNGCLVCHKVPKVKGKTKRELRKINFLHSAHGEKIKECAMCHTNMDAKPHKPGNHESCGKCHKQDIESLMCAKCHRKLNWAGIVKVKGFKHESGYFETHGKSAGKSTRVCSQCHTQNFCTDCHGRRTGIKPSFKYPEKAGRGFMHHGDWLTLHRIEAKTGKLDCLKCHGQKDCSSCHMKSKISPASDKTFFGHPAGWLSKSSGNFHGSKARENIVSCATCHEGGGPGDCVTCHKASTGRNPHPPGFSGGGLDKNSRMCSKCHGK